MQQASVPPPAALVPVPAHPDEAAARQTARRYQQLLADYRWQLMSAKDREGNPRTWFASGTGVPGLEFSKEEKDAAAEPSLLLHSQLCQRQVDGWLVLRRYQVQGADPQREVAWQLTLRGDAYMRRPPLTCRTSPYNAEQRLLQMLSGGHALRMRIDQPNKGGPQLEVDDGFGGLLRFQGTLLAENQRHHLQGVETLLQVKETAAPCASTWSPGERCLLFREVRLDAAGEAASAWNDTVLAVDRYTHVAGTDVMLRVRPYGKANAGPNALRAYRAQHLLWTRGEAMPTVAGVSAAAVLEPEQPTFFPKLLLRFAARDRSLAGKDFTHLYYGNWLQQVLGPRRAGASELAGGEELAALESYLELRGQVATLDKADSSSAVRQQRYRDFLVSHPMHLNALEDLAGAGDADARFAFEGLLQAIKSSGDGQACESPWIVTSSADIGVLLRHLKLERDHAADRTLGDGCVRVGAEADARYFLVLDAHSS
ncbi:DUF4919 domain-containing protein [Stenotrophomonas terrae]|uniref:DUF4919 domain-containing protein n=1 Tax=Stenotrophomonas terrae TaxID=405446 RepID=UPI00320BA6CC